MEGNVAWKDHREESQAQDARAHQQEVPQEVDGGGPAAQLVLLPQEAAQGLVVVQEGPGDTQERGANPKH